MNFKKLFACAAIVLGCGSAFAQTDVTSTYLDNAGFDESTNFIKKGVCTYAADVTKNSADGSSLMTVPNWTAGLDGDGKAGGSFGFGTKAWLTGTGYVCPDTDSDGKAEGGVLGLGGCWDNNAYYTQNLKEKLPAGTYTIEIKGYNAGDATAFGTQTFGIMEEGGKTHYVTTTWTTKAWTTATVKFELTEETACTFYLGATKVSGGSAKSAKLFIDYVKIYKAKSLQDLMDEATVENPADVTSFYLQNAAVTGTDGWTNGRVNSGQQYTDAPDNTYLDTWNATLDQKQKVTLKPGKYTLKAATRAVAGISVANIYANVKDGSKNSTDITAVGNTDGELGNGWGWTTVDFIVTEEAEVTIGFYSDCGNGKWAGADNFTLYYDRKIQDSDLMPAALAELEAALNDAVQIDEDYVGEGAFMYDEDEYEDYDDIMSTASMYLYGLVEGATLQDVKDQIDAVKDATVPSLNAPESTQAYKIILKFDGWKYDNCAMTTMAGARSDMGNYNIQYMAQNANYAQAMYFNAVEGGYKISFIDADGNTRYISTGVPYGGNASQIRTTTTADDALVVEVRRNGGYIQLYNTAANHFVGSQDAGVFTVDSHIDFVVEETESLNLIRRIVDEGKYGTIVWPFDVPTSAYEPTIEGNTVVLTEVETMKANKPYIVGPGEYFFEGVNIAYKDTVVNGILTGVYTDYKVPVDSYVLQTKEDGTQAFFKVVTDAQPTLTPNKAYLTVPEEKEESAKALNFADSAATAIKALNALTSGNAKIYDINGRELKSLQKGVNIVNGVKVMVK